MSLSKLQSVLLDTKAEPMSMNRKLLDVLRLSTLDVMQASLLAGITPTRLAQYFAGQVFLIVPELSALARVLRDTLHENNARLARVLDCRPKRRVRKPRSPEATAKSLEAAREALAAKRASAVAV